MSNFLGLRCPECGVGDGIRISATTWLDVTEDGTSADNSDHEYEPGSLTHCTNCGHMDTLKVFENGEDE